MKRLLFLTAILATFICSMATPRINRIEPPYWWTGMAQDTLQLMVYGPGIGNADVKLDYPGVRLIDTVRLESPNYLCLLYTSDAADE